MKYLTLAALLLSTVPADACHHYSIWLNSWPQPCPAASHGVRHVERVTQKEDPPPSKEDPPPIEKIMPLPSLDTEFPPECSLEWCQRLKGIGILRERLGTN